MAKDKKKKKFVVRLWYTWYDDVEVEAENAEEAESMALEMPLENITEDFSINDLELDTTEIFGGEDG